VENQVMFLKTYTAYIINSHCSGNIKRIIALSLFVLTGCNNLKSRKENQLANEMNAFLTSGSYKVLIREFHEGNISSKSTEAQVTLTNTNIGMIEFKGVSSFNDLDSIKISLNDSTLVRQFSVNPFIDTTSVTADKSGVNEDYFGYAFGRDYEGGIADIPAFRQFFNKDNISGSQFLFIVGRTKNNNIIIRRIERVISSGEELMNVNKAYVLTSKHIR
jgi:hypothetical protein